MNSFVLAWSVVTIIAWRAVDAVQLHAALEKDLSSDQNGTRAERGEARARQGQRHKGNSTQGQRHENNSTQGQRHKNNSTRANGSEALARQGASPKNNGTAAWKNKTIDGPGQTRNGAADASEPRRVVRDRKTRVLGTVGAKKRSLKKEYSFYHSTAELLAETKRLAAKCPGMTLEVRHDRNVTMHAITVRAGGQRPKNQVFLVSGEHAREIIGPETALHFVKALCKEVALGGPNVDEVLKNSDFRIVIDGNPRSRRRVDEGMYCVRLNPNGVDLNRNWDKKWENQPKNTDLYGGPHPFSEPETRMLRELIEEFKPTTFLSIHSGTRGLYMPWAYDMAHTARGNQKAMMRVLQQLDADHCECPYGAAGTEVGYKCPGTSLDWVYDRLGAPYSFAFEVWGGDEEALKHRWQRKLQRGGTAVLQQGGGLAHPHFREFFQDHPSEFIQVNDTSNRTLAHELSENAQDPDFCLKFYNPFTQESYTKAVKNWALAYLECSLLTAEELRTDNAHKDSDAVKQVLLAASSTISSLA